MLAVQAPALYACFMGQLMVQVLQVTTVPNLRGVVSVAAGRPNPSRWLMDSGEEESDDFCVLKTGYCWDFDPYGNCTYVEPFGRCELFPS